MESNLISLMQAQLLAMHNPFAPMLLKWQWGIPVDCGKNWEWDTIAQAVTRGPNPFALTSDAIALFQEDITYQQHAKFCKVVDWGDLPSQCPPKLKISPVAVVPESDCHGCIILNLSFTVYVHCNGTVQPCHASVNATTFILASQMPAQKLGLVFPWLCQYLADTPSTEWLLFSKLDIIDGFWCLVVQGNESFQHAL